MRPGDRKLWAADAGIGGAMMHPRYSPGAHGQHLLRRDKARLEVGGGFGKRAARRPICVREATAIQACAGS